MVPQASAVPLTAPLALVLDLLAWVAARPRTYAETMDAWRTSCPRQQVWEDAMDNDFLTIAPDAAGSAGLRGQVVGLTDQGRAFLDGYARGWLPK